MFSSLSNFMSSGYVLTAIIVLVGFGIAKKAIKLCVTATIVFVLWTVFKSGVLDEILAHIF